KIWQYIGPASHKPHEHLIDPNHQLNGRTVVVGSGNGSLRDEADERFNGAATGDNFSISCLQAFKNLGNVIAEISEHQTSQSGHHCHRSTQERAEHDTQANHQHHLTPNADATLGKIPFEGGFAGADV